MLEKGSYLLSQLYGILFWTSDLFEHVQDRRSVWHRLQTCASMGFSVNYLGHASQTRASGGTDLDKISSETDRTYFHTSDPSEHSRERGVTSTKVAACTSGSIAHRFCWAQYF